MTIKPTHKAIHIGKSHQPTHKPKLAKEYVFAYADRRTKKKYDCPTKAIRNLGNVLILKCIALNKISSKLKINCFKIPNYA